MAYNKMASQTYISMSHALFGCRSGAALHHTAYFPYMITNKLWPSIASMRRVALEAEHGLKSEDTITN